MENDDNAPPTGKDDHKPGNMPRTKRHKIEMESDSNAPPTGKDGHKLGKFEGTKRHKI